MKRILITLLLLVVPTTVNAYYIHRGDMNTTGFMTVGKHIVEGSVNGSTLSGSIVSTVDNDATTMELVLNHYNDTSATGSIIYGARSRGTFASPAVVQDDDNLLDLFAIGHDGTDWAVSSAIRFEVDGTPGNDDMPGRIVLQTSPDGAQVPVTAITVNSDQSVLIDSVLVQDGKIATDDAVDLATLSATGTASSSTFLRGDNSWATPSGSGDVSKVGTPVNNQVGVWTGDGTIEGDTDLTFDGTDLTVGGAITATSVISTGSDGTHGVTITNNTSTPTLDPNTLSVDQNTLVWNDSGDTQQEVYHEGNKDTAIVGSSITSGTVANDYLSDTINNNYWTHNHKDLTQDTESEIDAVDIPNNVDWTSVTTSCDGTTDAQVQPYISTSMFGTYAAVGSSAAFDLDDGTPTMTGWTDLLSTNTVKLVITTAHTTGDATECSTQFTLRNN